MLMRESIFSVELQKILHKVGQQSYTPVTSKEPEDSRKLGSDIRQRMGHTGISSGALWEAGTEKSNPQVINRNTIIRKKMEK